MKEIGSEFWVEDLNDYGNNIFSAINGDIRHTLSGRTAIRHVLKEIKDKVINKTVYFPSYFCESMIAPFLQMNYQVIYYEITEFLDATLDLKSLKKSGAFYICDYFGNQTVFADEVYEICSHNNIIIIHDITMAIFPLKPRRADYLIGSFRKWFGVACGGFAVSQNKKFSWKLEDSYCYYVSLRNSALSLKRKYILEDCTIAKTEYLALFNEAEELLDKSDEPYSSDEASVNYLHRYSINDMVFKRLRNYKILFENLSFIRNITPVFKSSTNIQCPMFFPLYSASRNILKNHLIKEDIFPPVHWPISQYHPDNLSPNTKKIYETIISIPCDQRYDTEDMLRIVQVIKNLEIF